MHPPEPPRPAAPSRAPVRVLARGLILAGALLLPLPSAGQSQAQAEAQDAPPPAMTATPTPSAENQPQAGQGPRAKRRSALSRDVCHALREAWKPPSPPSPPPAPATSTPASPADAVLETVEAVAEATSETAGPMLDNARRRLYQTACTANLWLDGLFGGKPDIPSAQGITGRVELSAIDQAVGGSKYRAKINAEFELPTLEGRLKAFIGRDDPDSFVAETHEGFALRSSLFGLESEDRWLAGLGYGIPGRFFQDSDVRVGVKLKAHPEVFTQARFRRNFFLGERTAWRFRETVFWKSTKDGFGSTTSIDFDRLVTPTLLFRWGNTGTVSQSTDGMAWRSVTVLYKNLLSHDVGGEFGKRARAIAWEGFIRGDTGGVLAGEYGVRAIYRQNILRSYLFAEVVVGYSWPRQEGEDRKGAETIGFGLEMAFGR